MFAGECPISALSSILLCKRPTRHPTGTPYPWHEHHGLSLRLTGGWRVWPRTAQHHVGAKHLPPGTRDPHPSRRRMLRPGAHGALASGVVHPKSSAGARAKHPLCGRCVSQQWFCECFAPTLRRTARWLSDAFWPHPSPGGRPTPKHPWRKVSPCPRRTQCVNL